MGFHDHDIIDIDTVMRDGAPVTTHEATDDGKRLVFLGVAHAYGDRK